MATVNIPRSVNDPNYRYKMPKLLSRIEGRGNGIRTNVTNFGDICRALQRPAMYTIKFFGCELGTQAKYEDSEEKAIVNGSHTLSALESILDKYIDMYVLCPECQLPEIDIIVKKGTLKGKCNACGTHCILDSSHKLATYIIKNPPGRENKTVLQKTAKEKNKEDIDDKKKGKKIEKRRSKDFAKEEKNKNKVLFEEKGPLTYLSDEIQANVDRLKDYIAENKDICPDTFMDELRLVQVAQNFDAKCRLYIMLCCLFSNNVDPGDIKKYSKYIKACMDMTTSPCDVIDALQHYLYYTHFDSINQYPYYLHKLYEDDLVEGSDILLFYKHPKENEIYTLLRQQATPFLEWLEEGESSTEGEIQSDNEQSGPQNVVYKDLLNNAQKSNSVNLNDLDIDAI